MCIRIYVTKKDMSIKSTDKDFIPKFLSLGNDEVCTDVVEIGEIKALSTCRTRQRPIKAGCSAMNYLGSACTLGWFAKNKKKGEEEFTGIVANNHCCARENKASKGEAYLYPSPYDGGMLSDKVAEHWRHVDIHFNDFTCPYRNFLRKFFTPFYIKQVVNEIDAGLELITIPLTDVLFEIFKIGKVKGKRRGTLGELMKKSGRTTGFTDKGNLIDNDWYGEIQYSRGTAQFGPCGLISKDNFSAGGDSSSAILTELDDCLVGLLFAGSESHTIYCHFDRVEDLLEVEFIVS